MLLFACFRLQNNLSTLTKKMFLKKNRSLKCLYRKSNKHACSLILIDLLIQDSNFHFLMALTLNIEYSVQIYIFFQELKLSCSWTEIRFLSCRSISRRFCEFQPLPAIFQVSFIAQVWAQKSVKS